MDVNDDLDSLETLSLTDFPLTVDPKSASHDTQNNTRNIPIPPPSPATTEDLLFEFSSGTIKMSDAKDIISGGKLIPVNDNRFNPGRCESMRELKTTGTTSNQRLRNSYSFDYRKLNRNNLSSKSSSARWTELVFAPLKVPPEMDLRDIRNRQNIIQNTSKSFAVNRVGGDLNRKTSWGVLGFLSCRRSGSVAVTAPLS